MNCDRAIAVALTVAYFMAMASIAVYHDGRHYMRQAIWWSTKMDYNIMLLDANIQAVSTVVNQQKAYAAATEQQIDQLQTATQEMIDEVDEVKKLLGIGGDN